MGRSLAAGMRYLPSAGLIQHGLTSDPASGAWASDHLFARWDQADDPQILELRDSTFAERAQLFDIGDAELENAWRLEIGWVEDDAKNNTDLTEALFDACWDNDQDDSEDDERESLDEPALEPLVHDLLP